MKKITSLLLCFLLLIVSLPTFAYNGTANVWKAIYVSNDGNDNASGTENDPFLTIARAQEEVRKLNDDMKGDIYVYLRGGIYNQTETLNFTVEDSGTNGYYIRYTAFPGEDVTVSGGKQVTGWTKTAENIWSAKVEGVNYIRTLDVNGKAGRRAQSEEMIPVDDLFSIEGSTHNSDGIVTKGGSKYATYENAEDIQIYFSRAWKAFWLNVEKIEKNGDDCKFHMEQPFFGQATTVAATHYVNPGNRFYLVNAFEEMDTPGEFYYNRKTQMLHYMPRADEDMLTARVDVPVIQTLMKISGEHSGNKIKNIVFDSITFAHCTWDRGAKHSVVGDQAQWYTPHKDDERMNPGFYMVPSNIVLDRAEKIMFTNNVVRNMGAVGIGLIEGVYNCQFVGNVFCDLADSAMTVGTMDTPYDEEPYKGRDLAHRKKTTANVNSSGMQDYSSWNAIDGNKKTGYSPEGAGPHWWQVDLEKPWRIHRIEIMDRFDVDNPIARSSFEILGSNDPTFETYTVLAVQGADPYLRGSTAKYYVDSEEEFQYVRIRKTDNGYIYLAEVRVINEDEEYAPAVDLCRNNLIKNNYITRIGRINSGAPGIQSYYTKGLQMVHNTVYDVPYSGLCCGWGWIKYNDAYACRDNNINYNHIEKVMQVSVDGGGIYTLDRQPNSTLIGNYVTDMPNPYGALYGDNTTSFYTYLNNVTENVNISALLAENGDGTRWEGNFTTATKHMMNTTPNQYIETFKYFIPRNQPVEVLDIIDEAGLEDDYEHIKAKAGENMWPRTVESQFNCLRYDPVFMIDNNLLTYVLRYYIGDCRMWLSLAEAGDKLGQYPQDAIDNFLAAIDKAAEVLKITPVDRDKVVTTRVALIEEAEKFFASRIGYSSERIIEEAEAELNNTTVGTGLGMISETTYNKFKSILEKYKKNTDDKFIHQYLEAYLLHFRESKIDVTLKDFTLPNQAGTTLIDHENGIVTVPMLYSQDVTSLVPTVDYREEGVTISPNLTLPQNFEKGVKYTLKTSDGTASKTYTIKISKPVPMNSDEPYSLEKIIADTEGWNSFGTYNNKSYTKELYGNTTFKFTAKVASRDTYDWPSLSFRSQYYDKSFDDKANSAYIVCFNPGKIELHRFNNGVRTQFWGPVANCTTIFGGSLETDVFKFDAVNDIEITTKNENGGVRIVITINGSKVIDFVDNYEGAITAPGYFGTVSPGSEVVLGTR